MKLNLLFSVLLVTGLTFLASAQTVSYHTNTGPSFKSFDGSHNQAGPTWFQPSYNDAAWSPTSHNGGGYQTPSCNCFPPSSCLWCTGDTVIWSKATVVAPDTACFRKVFNLGRCGRVTAATFSLVANDFYFAYFNGHYLGTNVTDDVSIVYVFDSTQLTWLHAGDNLIATEVNHPIPCCAQFSMVGTVTLDTTGCATTGIKDIDDQRITVSPNPASNFVNISVISDGNYNAVIYDMAGRKVFSEPFSGYKTTVDISSLSKATYTLQVNDDFGQIAYRQIVKE